MTNNKTTDIMYDAFISYRHTELDSYVAKNLQKFLEHYHIPRKIQQATGKRKITRIFRDKEELSLSSDLNDKIQIALKNSEYLIVICSPESKESTWVQKEINFFLQNHNNKKENILIVHVKGEPQKVFPEILLYREQETELESGEKATIRIPVEPLAADLTGTTKREIGKKLKTEGLRLISRMLSCTYDDLRQRHREYKLQQGILASFIVSMITFAFMIYAFHQSNQINEQYQKARINQARYLCDISAELLASGNRIDALLTALAIQPENGENEAVVPEQIYALNNALHTYTNPNIIDYYHIGLGEIENFSSGEPCKDGNYYLALDKYGKAYFLDVQTGTCIWSLYPEEIGTFQTNIFTFAYPVSESTAILGIKNYLLYVDIDSHTIIRSIQTEDTFYAGSTTCQIYENKLLIYDTTLHMYDLLTGKQLFYHEFENSLAIAVYNDFSNELILGFKAYDNEADSGLFIYDLQENAQNLLTDASVYEIFLINETHIATINADEDGYYMAVYDISNCSCVFESPKYSFSNIHYYGIQGEALYLEQEVKGYLVCFLENQLFLYDFKNQEIVQEYHLPSYITGIEKYDNTRLLLSLYNGTIRQVSTTSEYMRIVNNITDPIVDFSFYPDFQTMILETYNTIVISSAATDETVPQITLPEEYTIRDIQYFPTDTTTYRCISTTNDDTNEYQLFIYETNQTDAIYESERCESITNIKIGNKNGIPYLCYIRNSYSSDAAFCMINLNSCEIILEEDLTSYDTLSWGSITYAPNMSSFFAERYYGGIVEFSVTESSIEPGHTAIFAKDDIVDSTITGTGNFLAFLLKDTSTSPLVALKIWNRAENICQTLNSDYTYSNTDSVSIIPGQKDSIALYSETQKLITIINCTTGNERCTIPVTNPTNISIVFFDNDNYLIISESGVITMWDLSTGNSIMQYESEFDGTLIADSSNHFFALKDNSYSYDFALTANKQTLSIFSVDEYHKFYPYADVNYGHVSFSAQEILSESGNHICTFSFLDYHDLVDLANTIINGKTLTETDRQKYFISSN